MSTLQATRAALYLQHRTALIDFATPIIGSRDLAEDVVQEAFMRFVPPRTQERSVEQPIGYLYRIVRNLAIDMVRRRGTEQRHQQVEVEWALPRAESTPEQAALLCDDLRQVNQCLAEMPDQTRIAIEMHRFGGYNLEEIAEALDLSVPTVHRMIRRGLTEIAGRLRSARQ